MQTVSLNLKFNVPSTPDFLKKYPIYKRLVDSKEGQQIFKVMLNPQLIYGGIVLTNIVGLPAVTAYAAEIVLPKNDTNYFKQFIGAVVCSIMELNGYKKTGKKKAIPIKNFTRGEVYKKI